MRPFGKSCWHEYLRWVPLTLLFKRIYRGCHMRLALKGVTAPSSSGCSHLGQAQRGENVAEDGQRGLSITLTKEPADSFPVRAHLLTPCWWVTDYSPAWNANIRSWPSPAFKDRGKNWPHPAGPVAWASCPSTRL